MSETTLFSLIEHELVVVETKNRYLIHRLAESGELFVVLEGLLLQTPNSTSKRVLSWLKTTGDFIGLPFLGKVTQGIGYEVAVEALGSVKVGRIKRTRATELIEQHPGGHKLLSEALAAEWLSREKRLQEALELGPEQHILAALARVRNTLGTPHKRGTLIDVKTHQLSHLSGMSAESTRRVLVKLSGEGLLAKVAGGRVLLFE